MAKRNIISLNSITAGKNEKFVNLDYEIYPDTYDVKILGKDNSSYGNENQFKGLQIFDDYNDYQKYKDSMDNHFMSESVFALDISNNDNLVINNKNYNDNIYSLFDVDSGLIIHNMYDIRDLCIKSPVKEYGIDKNVYGINGYVDVYAPSLKADFDQSIQDKLSVIINNFAVSNGCAYYLTERIEEKPTIGSTNLLSNRMDYAPDTITDSSWKYGLKDAPNYISLYPSVNDVVSTNVSASYVPDRRIDRFKNNYVFEMPLNYGESNDYVAGDVLGNYYKCKNSYNPLYSMEMDSKNEINNTREYIGIGNCGGTVFLKYLDNVDIELNSNRVSKENKTTPKYQKVESLDSSSKFSVGSNHRSTLYSIKIKETEINSLDYNSKLSELKTSLIKDIENNVRGFVKRLCPANTELFELSLT